MVVEPVIGHWSYIGASSHYHHIITPRALYTLRALAWRRRREYIGWCWRHVGSHRHHCHAAAKVTGCHYRGHWSLVAGYRPLPRFNIIVAGLGREPLATGRHRSSRQYYTGHHHIIIITLATGQELAHIVLAIGDVITHIGRLRRPSGVSYNADT